MRLARREFLPIFLVAAALYAMLLPVAGPAIYADFAELLPWHSHVHLSAHGHTHGFEADSPSSGGDVAMPVSDGGTPASAGLGVTTVGLAAALVMLAPLAFAMVRRVRRGDDVFTRVPEPPPPRMTSLPAAA